MNKRDLKLTCYEISKYRYRELYYFCRQYDDYVSSGNVKKYQILKNTAAELGSIGKYILKSVIYGMPYEYLGDVPCSRKVFYTERRKFFYILNQKMDN